MLPEFIYMTCQIGSEAILKHEISREWPTFKFAYSRPGFLTFKVSPDADLSPGFDLRCVFARSFGISLGKAQGSTTAERAVYSAMMARQQLPGVLRLSVFERDKAEVDAESAAPVAPSALVQEVERRLREAQENLFLPPGPAQEGEVVFTLVLVEDNEWWMGFHLHSRRHRPWSGGIAPLEMPKLAPSRAYLKLREGLSWPGLPVRPREKVLELGSSPGGASLALLEQGLEVLGCDPADMAKVVLDHPKFRHLRMQARQLRGEDVSGGVDWIVSDMNVTPEETLETVQRLMTKVGGDRLLGALLTLKLSNWARSEEIPESVRTELERLLGMGFTRVQAAHLYFNRREVCVACYTARGEERLLPEGGKKKGTAKSRKA